MNSEAVSTIGILESFHNEQLQNTGVVIEKGTSIYIPIHYDPQYFPDPYKFDSERFSEENKRNIPSCVYYPFEEGPHE
ncbi:Cytochrome P450 6j1 [Ooceraea biroi]|uniref:Cytochrome P450 6j1 n=1 Tax=Ooceraea biroi TaxID=2015173 RepID=A0A026X2I5_OOCBI|nr:Cytochrome P450 6j1 [Ooceraea biroi]